MTSASIRTTFYQWLAVSLLMLFSVESWADSLTATVDRNQLGRGETLELQVRYDGQTTSDPDFSPLERDFEIVGQHRQNQFSIMNGSSQSYTQWTLQLLPKKTGRVLLPALEFKGVQSDPISLQVDQQTSSNSGSEPVFIETEVDKGSVYVQEQLLLTLRLYTSVPLQRLSSEELMVKDAALVKVAENQYQKRNNGIAYQVVELKYALFPEASGELVVPAVRFNAVIPDRRDPFSGSLFGSRGKPVFLLSEEQRIDVKPRPTSFGSGDWLPGRGLSLSERWSRPLDQLTAGEPVTRTITMTAQGLMDSQLPPLAMDAGDGFKVYPDQPQLENNIDGSGVIGTRVESVAIVPSRGGQIILPPIRVRWWDTASQQVRETELAGHILQVKAAEGTPALAPQSEPAAAKATTPDFPAVTADTARASLLVWVLIIANLILLIAVVVLFLLWRNSRDQSSGETAKAPVDIKESELFKVLQKRSGEGNPRAFREALLLWASAFWQTPLTTLCEVSRIAATDAFSESLEALDRALYSPDLSHAVDLNSIFEQVKALRKNRPGKPDNGTSLMPLYGNRGKH